MMPIYTWKCRKCEELTETIEAIKDFDKPPQNPCSKCSSIDFEKQVDASRKRWYFNDKRTNYAYDK